MLKLGILTSNSWKKISLIKWLILNWESNLIENLNYFSKFIDKYLLML